MEKTLNKWAALMLSVFLRLSEPIHKTPCHNHCCSFHKESFHYRSSGLLCPLQHDMKCELAHYTVRVFAVQMQHFQRPDVCGLSSTLNTVYSC